jgi:quercetin dioxygenase-like cupin family protein
MEETTMLQASNRRTILQTLAAGLALAAEGSSSEVANQVINKDQARKQSEAFGDLRFFVEGSTGQLKGLTVGSIELKPGQAPHPPHTHPEEELMIVTDGHAEITLEGKVTPVGPGSVMYASSNRIHGIVNISTAPMTFFWIKWMAK